MSSRSNSSRERILGTAESVILQKGFAGTTIDDILAKAAITKGGFFYHFSDKKELARALVERYLEEDEKIFTGLFRQADELSEDPLHQVLIFLKLFAQMMSELEDTHPGCLVASFTYESYQFDDELRDLIRQGVLSWRGLLLPRFAKIVERYPREEAIALEPLADMFTSMIEGGIILSRVFGDNRKLVEQINAYRAHLRMVFGNL